MSIFICRKSFCLNNFLIYLISIINVVDICGLITENIIVSNGAIDGNEIDYVELHEPALVMNNMSVVATMKRSNINISTHGVVTVYITLLST